MRVLVTGGAGDFHLGWAPGLAPAQPRRNSTPLTTPRAISDVVTRHGHPGWRPPVPAEVLAA